MKKLSIVFAFVIAGISFVSCDKEAAKKTTETGKEATEKVANNLDISNSEVKDAIPLTEIKVNKEKHDFGSIKEGDVVKTTFLIENTGENPLVLTKAGTSCGCTVPKIEKNVPIAPGKTTEIVVEFNSTNKPNKQYKQIKLHGNFNPSPKIVSISADVTPKPKEATVKSQADGHDNHDGHNH